MNLENLTDQEKQVIIKTIPNKMLIEELENRLTSMTDTINHIKDVFKSKGLSYGD